MRRWWQVQVQTVKVLQRYRSAFAGKSSPILFYWGSFDLNSTRFSGRPATPPPGPWFFRLAENQENVLRLLAGQPDAARVGVPRARPTTAMPTGSLHGFKEAAVRPSAAYYNAELGEFLLHYEDARRAPAPEQAILDFYSSVYGRRHSWRLGSVPRWSSQPE